MTKPLGKLLKLYYENPAAAGTYLALANTRSNTDGVSNEEIDVTDKDGMPDKELIEGGIRSSSHSVSGIFSDAASVKLMKQWARQGSIKNFQIVDGLGNTKTGPFLVASFEHAGEFDGEQTYDLKLSSSGAMTYVDV